MAEIVHGLWDRLEPLLSSDPLTAIATGCVIGLVLRFVFGGFHVWQT